jgi:hypothetical protein
VADALAGRALLAQLGPAAVDIVITDVPYGLHSAWVRDNAGDASREPLWRLLDALRPVLAPGAVLAIVSDKAQRAQHEHYQQIGRLQIGKRRATFLMLAA